MKQTCPTPMSSHTDFPKSSLISAITTFAPCSTNDLTIHSPMPRAPPVTIATLFATYLAIGFVEAISAATSFLSVGPISDGWMLEFALRI
ncbi:hypothetical protein HanXRQr2_Chr12g0560311 [Helianthus annuus]|uniref:Uncharacterized protein n=1 Tax=Helianthus annuus TaxID=4232 RepID=A0A9K3MXN2_HELAN|nr:hypothetical protein HanXRQr2_Chr12g0560311 [Helianthus annuus]